MIIGLLLAGLAGLLAYIEIKASRNRKEEKKAIQLVTKKVRLGGEAMAMGAGSASMSLYDLYAAAANHAEVLDVLEQRFPHAVDQYSPGDWLAKISSLSETDALNAYVSAYAGQKAENLSVEYFKDQGLHAELFASRTHPNDDMRVYQDDGSYIDYSVKSLDSTSHFQQEVATHPESTHYVVNRELYDDLAQKGLLHTYQEKGITIESGGYSNTALREEAVRTFEDIESAGNVADHIPFIAASLFGYKTFKNALRFKEGTQSAREFSINVTSDTVRLGTSGLSAFAGAKGGALIGTAVSPGLGTIIGGGIGAVISAYSGSKFINWMTNKMKWSHIFKAQQYYGMMNRNKIKDEIAVTFANALFGFHELSEELEKEEALFERYKEQFNPFSKEDKLSIPATLCHLHIQKLNSEIDRMRTAVDMTRLELLELSDALAEKLVGRNSMRKNMVHMQFYGEVFLSNECLAPLSLGEEADELAYKYYAQKEKNPNYPTRYPFEAKDIFEGLAIKNYKKLQDHQPMDVPVHNWLAWKICAVLAIVSLSLFTSTFKYVLLLATLGIFGYFALKIVRNFQT